MRNEMAEGCRKGGNKMESRKRKEGKRKRRIWTFIIKSTDIGI